jgi:hypothetical protein
VAAVVAALLFRGAPTLGAQARGRVSSKTP